jgi:hypothetical protein
MDPRDDDRQRDETDPDKIGCLDRRMPIVKLTMLRLDK